MSGQLQNDKTKGTSVRKKIGVILIIIGVVCGLLGAMASSKMADSYEGVNYTTGYRLNGEYIVTDTGTVGGNSQGVAHYRGLRNFFIVMAVVIILAGGAIYFQGKKYESQAVTTKRGMIIDGDGTYAVTIEFNDGERKRYLYNPAKLILRSGDFGDFELKGQTIIDFDRISSH